MPNTFTASSDVKRRKGCVAVEEICIPRHTPKDPWQRDSSIYACLVHKECRRTQPFYPAGGGRSQSQFYSLPHSRQLTKNIRGSPYNPPIYQDNARITSSASRWADYRDIMDGSGSGRVDRTTSRFLLHFTSFSFLQSPLLLSQLIMEDVQAHKRCSRFFNDASVSYWATSWWPDPISYCFPQL